MNNYYANS